MKISIGVITLLMFCLTSIAQTKTAKDFPKTAETNKFIEQIAGEWKLQQIVDVEGKTTTTTNEQGLQTNKQTEGSGGSESDETSNAMQMLEFNPDGRYKMNNATNAVDSGSYRLNEQHGILYLESDADDVTPTEWTLNYKEGQLSLEPRNQEAERRFTYVYQKVKEKVSTN